MHRFEREGLDGPRDKKGRGRKAKLQEAQEAEIKNVLANQSQEVYGYNTATWTGPLLIDWIKKQYGIEYKKAQIYNIIKLMGFSYQKGRGIFPVANAEKQEASKEGLKKTSGRKSLMLFYYMKMNFLCPIQLLLATSGPQKAVNRKSAVSKDKGKGKQYLVV